MSFHRNVTTSRVLFVSFENGAERKNTQNVYVLYCNMSAGEMQVLN